MKMIKIYRNANGDTRTATKMPTISEFQRANLQHCSEVSEAMATIASMISCQGGMHDYTKISEPGASKFFIDFAANMIQGESFEDGDWFKSHIHQERHHLLDACPQDVNLIDVIEMICDCVCAGIARRGEVTPVKIPANILLAAVCNTQKLLEGSSELVPLKEECNGN